VVAEELRPDAERGASLGRRIEALALSLLLLVVTLVVGWLVWSVFEWRHGRTPSYRILGLRVVRRGDGRPVGVGRSLLREALCWLVLVPTIVIGALAAVVFVMGASPPDGLLRDPRPAPWDRLTSTWVVDERAEAAVDPGADESAAGVAKGLRPNDVSSGASLNGAGRR
jgi:uncharacterized RDD family membrane protein YckC